MKSQKQRKKSESHPRLLVSGYEFGMEEKQARVMVEGSSRLFSHKDLFFKRIEFPFRICRMNLRQQPGVRGLSC